MYAVYTRWSEVARATGKVEIIALYARKGGALIRAAQASNAAPGISYHVAILPEGSEPKFDNLTDRVACFCLTEPQENTLDRGPNDGKFGEPDTDDMPF